MSYCNLANNGLYVSTIGDIGHCCMQKDRHRLDWDGTENINEWYKKNSHLMEIRNTLNTDGERHSACESCWAKEDAGFKSKRMGENQGSRDDNVAIKYLDLRLSNKCNLQCRMCSPGESSQLEKLAQELNEPILTNFSKNKLSDTVNVSKFLDSFLEIPTIQKIRFAGGEPFIMPEVEEFLYKLVEKNIIDIEIEFITNCTSAKTNVIELLEKFKRVDLGCSIDATGDAFEYQRYPAKWSRVERNFTQFYNSKLNLNITPCVSFLTYLDLDKFFEWANKFPNATVFYNEVDLSFMDFRLIPMNERTEFINKFKNIKFQNANVNWQIFQNKKMYEESFITTDERNLLLQYMKVWDYKNDKKFLDMYPWAERLLNDK